MEHVVETHKALNAIHPFLGKLFFIITIIGVVTWKVFKDDVSWIVSVSAGMVTLGYYAWRWRHNYRLSKKHPDKFIR